MPASGAPWRARSTSTTGLTYEGPDQLIQSSIGGENTVYSWDSQNAWRTSQGPSSNPTRIPYISNADGLVRHCANSANSFLHSSSA